MSGKIRRIYPALSSCRHPDRGADVEIHHRVRGMKYGGEVWRHRIYLRSGFRVGGLGFRV
jgi:hypothetical protein